MNVVYKRELNHNFLILEEDKLKEDYQICMLMENHISGLLDCKINRINQKVQFYYEITSKQSLELVLERKKLGYQDLVNILKSIQNILDEVREYLLDVNHLILNPEYLFVDMDTEILSFCYFPNFEGNIKDAFFDLAEYLLGKLDRQDRAGVALGYELYKLAGEENCSVEQILRSQPEEKRQVGNNETDEVKRDFYREETVAETAEKYAPAEELTIEKNLLRRKLFGENRRTKKNGEMDNKSINCKAGKHKELNHKAVDNSIWNSKEIKKDVEQIIFHNVENPNIEPLNVKKISRDPALEGTRILSNGATGILTLYCSNQGFENILITKESYLIGKKKDAVDGFINHKTISRIHGRISKSEEKYYLSDLNSTNGTFLNGAALDAHETVELKIGDSIRFAEVEYVLGY